MAHLYLMTCANLRDAGEWSQHMKSQGSAWPRENLLICKCGEAAAKHPIKNSADEILCAFTPRKESTECQWNLKPIQLWELVAPKEAMPEIMWYNHIPLDGKPQVEDKYFSKASWLLRKAIGIQPIPKFDIKNLTVRPRIIPTDAMRIYALGYKEDIVKEYDFGKEGKWIQEGL